MTDPVMAKARICNSLGILLLAALALCSAGCVRTEASASTKRIIVLGIDGMDPNFLERHWDALPNLDKLRFRAFD